MCGIFGYVGKIDSDKARLCLDTLTHRGPDGWGLWSGEGVTLGHRRLAILDLSENGKQPMSFASDRYWITFNGEIYNFLEIRAELQAKGHSFRSESDTEVCARIGTYSKSRVEFWSMFQLYFQPRFRPLSMLPAMPFFVDQRHGVT